jgi:hypothetical protein
MSTAKKLNCEVWIVSHDKDTSRFKSFSAARTFAKTLVQNGKLVEHIHPEQRMIELVVSDDRPMMSVKTL